MNLLINYQVVMILKLKKGEDFYLGQRQIIAFLRAYVYQPQLLILDEATSSIDSLSEEFIQNATEEITKSRTSNNHSSQIVHHPKCRFYISNG